MIPAINTDTTPILLPDMSASSPVALAMPRTSDPLSLEMVELELALDISDIRALGFASAVREATESLQGEYLFDLPASGLAESYQRIAVVRVTQGGKDQLVMVMLHDDGEQLSVSLPDERTAGLADFARAFIDVLEKF